MYQKTTVSQTEFNRGLKNQLVDMTKSRDECLEQIGSLKTEPL